MKRLRTRAASAALVPVLALGSGVAFGQSAGGVRFGPYDVSSVVFVAKSENRNEVHYAIALDDRCVPAGAAPVFAYWRMRERGDAVVEPLLDREVRAYGVLSQRVEGSVVHARLRALGDRTIVFETRREDGRCVARAVATVSGRRARLTSVYVKLGFPFRVDHLLVQGVALDDGKTVRERVSP